MSDKPSEQGTPPEAKTGRSASSENELSSQEAAFAEREELLRVREEASAAAWGALLAAAGDLREANEHLVLANLRSQALAEEMKGLYEAAAITLQEKDEVFERISHDLRNPLTSMAGWAAALERDPAPKMIANATQSIAKSAAIQAKLLNDLLDISRIVKRKFAIEKGEISLSQVAEDAVIAIQPLAVAKNITLTWTVHESVAVRGDGIRLRQVIDNLLSNALKFTPRSGLIELRVIREGEHAILVVADNGVGISSSFLPRVFDRHAQADPERFGGLGLGLAIVEHIVKMHDGAVAVTSDGEGKGATVSVRIPLLSQG